MGVWEPGRSRPAKGCCLRLAGYPGGPWLDGVMVWVFLWMGFGCSFGLGSVFGLVPCGSDPFGWIRTAEENARWGGVNGC